MSRQRERPRACGLWEIQRGSRWRWRSATGASCACASYRGARSVRRTWSHTTCGLCTPRARLVFDQGAPAQPAAAFHSPSAIDVWALALVLRLVLASRFPLPVSLAGALLTALMAVLLLVPVPGRLGHRPRGPARHVDAG